MIKLFRFPTERRFGIESVAGSADIQILVDFHPRGRVVLQRLATHFGHEAFLVKFGFQESAETVKLHQVVNLFLRRREQHGRGRLEAFDGSLPGVRVDVNGFRSSGGQVTSYDVRRDLASFFERRVDAETSVALARRPEVNVFMAELFLEKLLKK